jgi:hypothetical protein
MDAAVEKSARDIARELMLGEVIAAALRQLRALDKPFLGLPEAKQREVINDVRDDVQIVIERAVEIIATDDRTRFAATVDQVTFKDSVKAVLTMPNTAASHELADTAGGRVFVVIEDPTRYTLGGSNMPKPEPDQRTLEGGEGGL